jgi:tellurite resistance protein
MCYVANSLRRIAMPGDTIDVARGVKFDDATLELSRVPNRPTYGGLSAVQRGAYLRWIASGRNDRPGADGFASLFLSGLERRALVDRLDLADVFEEVLRLLSGRSLGPSVRGQFEQFAWFLIAQLSSSSNVATRLEGLAVHTTSWPDIRLCVLAGVYIVTRQHLPGWAAFLLASQATNHSTECSLADFSAIFAQRHPTGMLLPNVTTQATITYQPVNAELKPISHRVPDYRREGTVGSTLAALLQAATPDVRPAPTVVKVPPPLLPVQPPPIPVRLIATAPDKPEPSGLLSILRGISPKRTPETRPVHSLTWCGPEASVELPHVGVVHAPLVYIDRWSDREPAAVRVDLPIAPAMHKPTVDRELDYWPRYDGLNLAQRRYFVDWLRAGRQSIPHELGYTFLFLYSLERRALVDRQDVALIVDEVVRLKRLYAQSTQPASRSFDSYTDQFLWFLALREPAAVDAARVNAIRHATRTWNEETLATMLGLLARDDRPLDADTAFLLTRHLPDAQQGVVVRRAGNELCDLFRSRFTDRFGEVMPLRSSKRDRRYGYRPASAALQTFEHIGPSPWGLQSQFGPLVTIWNECVEALRKFSSARRAASDGALLTAESWAALPDELRDDIEHPLAARVSTLVKAGLTPDGQIRATIDSVATALEVKPTNGRLTPAASRKLVDALTQNGFGVEPDAHLTGKGYDGDDVVALFRVDDVDPAIDAVRFGLASTMLRVGMYLASTDGTSDERESTIVNQQVSSTLELSEAEERRLAALRGLLGAKGVELTEVTKLLRKLDPKRRELMSQLVLAIVAADGVITAEELVAVRKLFKAIGFEKDEVDRTIDGLKTTEDQHDAAGDEAPVVVAQAVEGEAGEPIPPRPELPPVIRLDRAAIARTLRESQEAAQLIADAMKMDGAEEVPVDEPQSVATSEVMVEAVSNDIGLPGRYAAFYQVVVTRPTWARAELAELARSHGLMLDGALDAINEWSTEKHNGPLIYDDGDSFSLEQSYLN